MKRLLLIIALLVAPGTAFADWDARKSEAMSELEKATMADAERAALKKALETYFGGREDCFEGLIAVIQKADEADQKATFKDRAGVCAVGANQVLGRALDDIDDPSVGALGFATVLSTNEAAFYQALGEVSVAEARDKIITIRARLEDMTEVLDGKWQTLLGDDKSLDERAQKMVEEIRADYATVLREAAEAHPDMAETLADAFKKLAEAETPDTPSPTVNAVLAAVKAIAVPLITLWQSTNTRMGARANSYRALFASELRVLVMFEDVREDVKEFLAENDWPKADAAYASAKSSLDSFVSSAKTSAQSSDASELRGDLMEQLATHLKSGADVYSKFVSKNRGRFEGALGPDIKEQLIEHREWEQYATYIEGYGLDAKLRDWHQHATNYFGVDLSAIKNEKAREELRTGLREIVEQLLKELKVAEEAGKTIEKLIEEERDDVAEELD
jgi:hypothetical protein